MFNRILSTVSIAAVSAMVLIGGSVAANAATFTPKGTKLQMNDGGNYNISIGGDIYGAVVDLGTAESFTHSFTFNLAQDSIVKWQIDNSDDMPGMPGPFGVANLEAYWDSGVGTIAAGTSTFLITDGGGNSLFPTNIGLPDWYKTVLLAGTHTLTFSGISLEGGSYTTEVSAITAVPLPPAALLFGTALFGIGALRRRKDKKAGIAA